MRPDAVLLLDDDLSVREGFRYQFEDASELELELIECSNYEQYEQAISKPENKHRIKAFILDLANSQFETQNQTFKARDYIQHQYKNNRVPIFVHSANIMHYDDLEDKGTVFKITKEPDSAEKIFDTIKLMKESGFLDVFCFEGSIEKKIMKEIHSAFTDQFKSNEIEEIIKSVKTNGVDKLKQRTLEIFERIALRSVYQNVISSREENQESVKLNAIEHFYRRSLTPDFYTGDIFEHSTSKKLVFVATPRCNIMNKNFTEILLCEINNMSVDEKRGLSSKIDNLRKGITDDVTSSLIGERKRFLPKTPQFAGGFVDFKNIFTILPDAFKLEYVYKISLVDDLTNDIIRKLSSYLLRGGISDTHYLEAMHYLKEDNSPAGS